MFKVAKECCNECLFSKDKIVSDERRKQLLAGIKKEQTFFICHKATLAGEQQICCRGFYDSPVYADNCQIIRIVRRMEHISGRSLIEEVDVVRHPIAKARGL